MSKTENAIVKNIYRKCRDPKGLGFLLSKILFVAVLGAFLFFVYSADEAKDVNLDDVRQAVTAETDMTSIMRRASERDLMQFLGLNVSDYDQVIYYRNPEALAVDEFLVVKAKNESQLAGVEDAVRSRIDSQIKAYSGYGPEQVKLLKSAALKKVGKYYIYCTAPKADEYKEVVLNAVQ